jgi:hypothetical protein
MLEDLLNGWYANLFVAEIPSTKPNPSLAHLGATFMV